MPPATLESVRAALVSVNDSEIIVVDNDSTDRTREIAAGFRPGLFITD